MVIEKIGPLRVERAPKTEGRRTRWRLIEPYVVTIDGEVYIVPAGFIFDGASIPSLLWWMFPPTYRPAWLASCFHDYCYRHLWKRVSKEWADEAFYRIMLKDGANKWIAGGFYWAVSRFGKGGW